MEKDDASVRKILLLGGSAQQVIAITTAKDLGYYTILCDFLPDNPGQYEADEFHLVSTTDMEAVLHIARERDVDGIVAYSSDPAAPTAAFVSEKLGLPGVPFEIAESFCNKNLFREYLKNNGFNVPKSVAITPFSETDAVANLKFPIIIKPTDSSGSKGVTVLNDSEGFIKARDYAAEISRNGILIAEEFIVRDHPDVIEAEIFVVDGKVTVWGLMDTIRDPYTNPLLPAAYSYPLKISEDRVELVRKEVQRLVTTTGVSYGAFNLEMVITKEEKLFFLDAGPRNGGNELPEFIGMILKDNLVEATLKAAMGDYNGLEELLLDGKSNGYWGMMVLHADREGTFQSIEYDAIANKCLLRESFFKTPGDYIGAFEISRDAIGLAFFEFPDAAIRDEIMNDFRGNHVKIVMS